MDFITNSTGADLWSIVQFSLPICFVSSLNLAAKLRKSKQENLKMCSGWCTYVDQRNLNQIATTYLR